DRIEVVGADEHGGGVPHSGEVHAGVEVGLRRGAVAEVHGGDDVVTLEAPIVRVANGVGELGGDGHGDDPRAVLLGVPSGVGEALPVGEEDVDWEAVGYLHAVLAIRGKDEV